MIYETEKNSKFNNDMFDNDGFVLDDSVMTLSLIFTY